MTNTITIEEAKLIRLAKGMTQPQMAAFLDVAAITYQLYETENRKSKLVPRRLQERVTDDELIAARQLLNAVKDAV